MSSEYDEESAAPNLTIETNPYTVMRYLVVLHAGTFLSYLIIPGTDIINPIESADIECGTTIEFRIGNGTGQSTVQEMSVDFEYLLLEMNRLFLQLESSKIIAKRLKFTKEKLRLSLKRPAPAKSATSSTSSSPSPTPSLSLPTHPPNIRTYNGPRHKVRILNGDVLGTSEIIEPEISPTIRESETSLSDVIPLEIAAPEFSGLDKVTFDNIQSLSNEYIQKRIDLLLMRREELEQKILATQNVQDDAYPSDVDSENIVAISADCDIDDFDMDVVDEIDVYENDESFFDNIPRNYPVPRSLGSTSPDVWSEMELDIESAASSVVTPLPSTVVTPLPSASLPLPSFIQNEPFQRVVQQESPTNACAKVNPTDIGSADDFRNGMIVSNHLLPLKQPTLLPLNKEETFNQPTLLIPQELQQNSTINETIASRDQLRSVPIGDYNLNSQASTSTLISTPVARPEQTTASTTTRTLSELSTDNNDQSPSIAYVRAKTSTCNKKKARYCATDFNEIITIGPNGTAVQKSLLDEILKLNYSMATRKLLITCFGRAALATHTPSGKRPPGFADRVAKKQLDPKIVADIICCVMNNYNSLSEKSIRNAMTSTCADEYKLNKKRQEKNLHRNLDNDTPSSSRNVLENLLENQQNESSINNNSGSGSSNSMMGKIRIFQLNQTNNKSTCDSENKEN